MPQVNGITPFWRVLPQEKPPAFTPTELVEGAIGYFDWCHENPLFEMDIRSVKDDGIVETPKALMRAFTIDGLCIYLGLNPSTFKDYRADPTYADAVGWIESVIRTQKFEGAAAGLLNANIISRDLGLADNVKQQHTSPDGSMTPQAHVNWEALDTETLKRIRAAGILNDTADES